MNYIMFLKQSHILMFEGMGVFGYSVGQLVTF